MAFILQKAMGYKCNKKYNDSMNARNFDYFYTNESVFSPFLYSAILYFVRCNSNRHENRFLLIDLRLSKEYEYLVIMNQRSIYLSLLQLRTRFGGGGSDFWNTTIQKDQFVSFRVGRIPFTLYYFIYLTLFS